MDVYVTTVGLYAFQANVLEAFTICFSVRSFSNISICQFVKVVEKNVK